MPNSIRAVLFDYGLVLSGPPSASAWLRMQQITGMDQATLHEAYWRFRLDYDRGTHTGHSYWQAISEHAPRPFSDAQITELFEADADLWADPNQLMIDWAARLQAAGTRTGILSNLGDRITEGLLRRLPWLAGFDFLLWSHTLGTAKPDPAIYAAAVAGLQTPAQNILFVDDREDNIAAAVDAGLQAIRFTDTASLVTELDARGLSTLWLTGRAE